MGVTGGRVLRRRVNHREDQLGALHRRAGERGSGGDEGGNHHDAAHPAWIFNERGVGYRYRMAAPGEVSK